MIDTSRLNDTPVFMQSPSQQIRGSALFDDAYLQEASITNMSDSLRSKKHTLIKGRNSSNIADGN